MGLNTLNIRQRIICSYGLVLGVALVGAGAGLILGNRQQQQALEFHQAAAAERKLLGDLQVKILYNRPAFQLLPYLDNPPRFREEVQRLLERLSALQTLLQTHHGIHEALEVETTHGHASHEHHSIHSQAESHGHHSPPESPEDNATNGASQKDLHLLLNEYESTVDRLLILFQDFIREINSLTNTPEDIARVRQLILELEQSPEFGTFIQFSDQLESRRDAVKLREQAAETYLQQSETLRTRVVVWSLLVATAIATTVALHLSWTITQPVKEITKTAHRITEERDFNLQVPIRREDDIGLLATSLNRLVKEVQQLFTKLGDKNAELEKALVQLNQQQLQLVQQEKMSALGQLIAGIAHEINNPVNFIYGNLTHVSAYSSDLLNLLKLYAKHYPNADPEIQKEAKAIDLAFMVDDLPKSLNSTKLGAERIQELVASLRTFTHIDGTGAKSTDIHAGLESTLLILRHRLKAQSDHSEIKVVRNYGVLPPVECYAGQLNQVFMNILVNAIDTLDELAAQETHQGKTKFSSQITITTSMIDLGWVQIAIADNGPGMSEEVRTRLFEPFFTTKPIGKGTGMGMSISQEIIVDNHHGRLRCLSKPHEGTEFQIEIPVKQLAKPSSQPQESLTASS